jgi:drug/metabolite transporter (DMT)-like permease
LGVFAVAGLIFQMDGLAYTAASTSAFLTQFYCLTIPLWLAVRERRWPPAPTVASCCMVVMGVAVLSEINWRQLRIGRGELETLIGSIIFTGQILWLQRPRFAANNVNHFTLVMFAVIALGSLPVAVFTGHPSDPWIAGYRPLASWYFTAILTGFCTLGGYLLMNYWQPHITATQAGLLYCLEPVFASLFAFFLPAWFSALSGIQYANEQLGWSLLLGGGLITAANVWIQRRGGTSSSSSQSLESHRSV